MVPEVSRFLSHLCNLFMIPFGLPWISSNRLLSPLFPFSFLFIQSLQHFVSIPSNAPGRFLLGPMGNQDPTDIICHETHRTPFKSSPPSVIDWDKSFRSWPTLVPGWRDWYRRVSASKNKIWTDLGISHCIKLSLANIQKNEPLLSSTSYFWHDTFNAFVFGHGMMTLTIGIISSGLHAPYDPLATGFEETYETSCGESGLRPVRPQEGTIGTVGSPLEGLRPVQPREEREKLINHARRSVRSARPLTEISVPPDPQGSEHGGRDHSP